MTNTGTSSHWVQTLRETREREREERRRRAGGREERARRGEGEEGKKEEWRRKEEWRKGMERNESKKKDINRGAENYKRGEGERNDVMCRTHACCNACMYHTLKSTFNNQIFHDRLYFLSSGFYLGGSTNNTVYIVRDLRYLET